MPFQLKYIDTQRNQEFQIDGEKEAQILNVVKAVTLPGRTVQDIVIDISSEAVEAVTINYSWTEKQTYPESTMLGGAIAWNVYRYISKVFPEIDHHRQTVSLTDLIKNLPN